MAPGSCFYHSLYQNFLINPADNELAGNPARALSKSNSSLASIFCASTLEPTFNAFPALGSTLSLASIANRYINKNLQRATMFALESFRQSQKHDQA